MNSNKFPQLDQEQARRHLELLGYHWLDKVYMRFFFHSSDSRKNLDMGRKSERLNIQQIETYQKQGRGVYLVVNGGGHKNDDVTEGRAVFIEHDNLPKEEQKELWKIKGLPEPTFQIDTGGKSIHSYWVLESKIEKELWCELQKDLLEFTDADRSIKNPARVMRLAGAYHVSIKEGQPIYNQSRIISESGNKYTYEELRNMIPSTNSHNYNNNGQKSSNDNNFPKHPDQVILPVSASVPLELCLAKSSRELLRSGSSQGARNTGGATLARDLIGTYQYLLSIGQTVDGNAYQLLSDYGQRCNPPLPHTEIESIWKSAHQSHPTPSCTPEGVNTCVRGWYYRECQKKMADTINVKKSSNNSKENQRTMPPYNNSTSSTVTADTVVNGDGSTQESIGIGDTVANVTAILKQGFLSYEEQHKLDSLQNISVMSYKAFWDLVKTIRCQLDEVQPEDKNRLNELLEWHKAKMDFERIFPEEIAHALIHDGEILNINPVMLVQYLLPTTLSLVGNRAWVNAESHTIPALIWTAIVAESGTGKSRAENVILDPIKKWQIEENHRFKQKCREYEELKQIFSKNDQEMPPEPVEKKYMFQMATIQAVLKRLGEQEENGSLWSRDELAGLLKSLGQFSNRGNDNEAMECFLELWDGKAAFVDRVDGKKDSFVSDKSCLSIAGGIQPKAFRQVFKDPDDAQGLQARFLYAFPEEIPMKRTRGYCVLSDKLPVLYHKIRQCPRGQINLSSDANKLFTQLVAKMGEKVSQSGNAAVRAWMRKLPSNLLRIAFALHIIEWAYSEDKDFYTLTVDTLERAAELATYYQNSFQVVQEKASDSDAVTSMLMKIYDQAIAKPDGISPRDAYRNIKAITRRAKDIGRQVGSYTVELFGELAQMGKGILKKEGRCYRFIAKVTGIDDGQVRSQNSELLKAEVKGLSSDVLAQTVENQSILSVETNLNPHESEHEQALSVTNNTSQSEHKEMLIESYYDTEINIMPSHKDDDLSISKTVTVATEGINHLQQELEPSTANDVSPSTVENDQNAELKALLMACQSFVELKTLSEKHGKRIKEAYDKMTTTEQLQIDGLEAMATPYEVYKYTGHEIEGNGHFLKQGMLVYLDPNHKNDNSNTISVWLMRGLEFGWHKAIDVSKDCLRLINKAINNDGFPTGLT